MTPASADTMLRNAHRATLVVLALCALLIASRPASDGEAPVNSLRAYAYAATVLAVGSIFTRRRRSPATQGAVATHVALCVASLVCAGGVGAIGVAASFAGGPPRDGWLYVLAGVIFALRPPPPVVTAPADGAS